MADELIFYTRPDGQRKVEVVNREENFWLTQKVMSDLFGIQRAATTKHLGNIFLPLPVRQWVLSVPKRLRWHLEREPKAVTAVLHIFLRMVEAHLRRSCPGATARARFGAVSFIHRFGAALNRHRHSHGCILAGLCGPLPAGGVQCRQASARVPAAVAVCEAPVRHRVPRGFSRLGLAPPLLPGCAGTQCASAPGRHP